MWRWLWSWLWRSSSSPHDVTCSPPMLDSFYAADEPLPDDERRQFDGVVLSVGETGCALSGGVWCGHRAGALVSQLRVGQHVRGEARRRSEQHGWLASHVQLVDDDQSAPSETAMTAADDWTTQATSGGGGGDAESRLVVRVQRLADGVMTASEGERSFTIRQQSAVISFTPHVGDLLVLTCDGGLSGDGVVPEHARVTLEPLRRWTMSGRLTHVANRSPCFSVVEDQVYFTPSAWRVPGRRPHRGDLVRCVCIESCQNSGGGRVLCWRALHVAPADARGWNLSAATADDALLTLPSAAAGVVAGRPPGPRRRHFATAAGAQLPQYRVPRQLQVSDVQQLLDSHPQLAEPLTVDNYASKLSVLLFIEEVEAIRRLRRYDMTAAAMTTVGEFLQLHVPGLSEGRPSLTVGDRAMLSHAQDNDGLVYEGFVHEVRGSCVLLRFDAAFERRYTGQEYDVVFQHSRSQQRYMHHAIAAVTQRLPVDMYLPTRVTLRPPQVDISDEEPEDCALTNNTVSTDEQQTPPLYATDCASTLNVKTDSCDSGIDTSAVCDSHSTTSVDSGGRASVTSRRRRVCDQLLRSPPPQTAESKPQPRINVDVKSSGSGRNICWFNRQLNDRQRVAVRRVLLGRARPMPYVIYGPPGTGKTATLVECALQLLTTLPHSRLLVAAPSNSAALLIAERMVHYARPAPCTLGVVRAFCHSDEPCASPDVAPFIVPAGELEQAVRRRRVLVATAASCGGVWRLPLADGHFSHVLVDEAGHLTEPATLVPLALVATSGQLAGQVVLAGDPRQLGPVLQSRAAAVWGLQTSLLQRLIDEARPYARDPVQHADSGGYQPALVTKLLDNYRSHRHLLSVPSQLFYDDELRPRADQQAVAQLCQRLDWLPRRGFPLLFHGVRSECSRGNDGLSWFNPGEAFHTLRYVNKLLAAGVAVADMGVIAPYRKQSAKIRELMRQQDVADVKVGSVEEFQGQEREVIIVTTVRSVTSQHEAADWTQLLGFMSDARRFNVCITRAKSLLIVVGNPDVLMADENWAHLVQFSARNQAYVGCVLSDPAVQCCEVITAEQ